MVNFFSEIQRRDISVRFRKSRQSFLDNVICDMQVLVRLNRAQESKEISRQKNSV